MIWFLPTFPPYCLIPCLSLRYLMPQLLCHSGLKRPLEYRRVHVSVNAQDPWDKHIYWVTIPCLWVASHNTSCVLVSTPLFVSFSLESDGLSFSCPGNQLQLFISTSGHRKREIWRQGLSYLSWTFSWAGLCLRLSDPVKMSRRMLPWQQNHSPLSSTQALLPPSPCLLGSHLRMGMCFC